MNTLIIDKQAIKENASAVKRKADGVPVYAVLTGDACGIGLLEAARCLREEGIDRFAVSEPEDAKSLRDDGFAGEEILMLRSTTDRNELERLLDLNVVCTVGSYETCLALNALAEERAAVAKAHLMIDTGMGCSGFLVAEPDKIFSVFRYLSSVKITGVYTQLRSTGKKVDAGAFVRFQGMLRQLREEGFETGVTHAAGSTALFLDPAFRLDAVRVRSAFFGLTNLPPRKTGLRPVASLASSVSEVRWLPKGHMVGSDSPVRIGKPLRVAAVPVGYYNGVGFDGPRAAGLFTGLRRRRFGRRLTVRLGEKKAKNIVHVGMLETILDVTKHECIAGDRVYFPIDSMFARGMERVYKE